MSKPAAIGMSSCILWCGLALASACNFGGDRSLGTIDSAAGARADAGVLVTSSAGASGGATSMVVGPLSCDTGAEQNDCAPGEFCYVNVTCGRGMDPVRGYCQVRPTECGAPSGFEVVCGCDGSIARQPVPGHARWNINRVFGQLRARTVPNERGLRTVFRELRRQLRPRHSRSFLPRLGVFVCGRHVNPVERAVLDWTPGGA